MNLEEQNKYKCLIGKDYPKPIVGLSYSRDRALKAFALLKEI